MKYNGGLTREQFLFDETRVVAKLVVEGYPKDQIIDMVYSNNLFQYPTEKMLKNIASVCYERIMGLDNKNLIQSLAMGSFELAKQVNFYAIIKKERLIYEFMTIVVADKYKSKDYSFSKVDLNIFFQQLQEQSDQVSTWSDSTIQRIKQVIVRMLIDVGYINDKNFRVLNEFIIEYDLERGIIDNGDQFLLPIFNRFM